VSERDAMPVLELRGVRAAYGRIEALHGVDVIVPPASVVALLGPNGAGKSTSLKVASGQMTPTAGCVHVLGRHVNGAKPDALARMGVCTIPEGRGIFPSLTVRENLLVAARRPRGAAGRRGRSRPSPSSSPICIRAGTSSPPRSPAVSSRCSRSAAR
jgi:ABC-type branched-subunit amino acid transport system ATPase component